MPGFGTSLHARHLRQRPQRAMRFRRYASKRVVRSVKYRFLSRAQRRCQTVREFPVKNEIHSLIKASMCAFPITSAPPRLPAPDIGIQVHCLLLAFFNSIPFGTLHPTRSDSLFLPQSHRPLNCRITKCAPSEPCCPLQYHPLSKTKETRKYNIKVPKILKLVKCHLANRSSSHRSPNTHKLLQPPIRTLIPHASFHIFVSPNRPSEVCFRAISSTHALKTSDKFSCSEGF
jgi:hypothetical protein